MAFLAKRSDAGWADTTIIVGKVTRTCNPRMRSSRPKSVAGGFPGRAYLNPERMGVPGSNATDSLLSAYLTLQLYTGRCRCCL